MNRSPLITKHMLTVTTNPHNKNPFSLSNVHSQSTIEHKGNTFVPNIEDHNRIQTTNQKLEAKGLSNREHVFYDHPFETQLNKSPLNSFQLISTHFICFTFHTREDLTTRIEARSSEKSLNSTN